MFTLLILKHFENVAHNFYCHTNLRVTFENKGYFKVLKVQGSVWVNIFLIIPSYLQTVVTVSLISIAEIITSFNSKSWGLLLFRFYWILECLLYFWIFWCQFSCCIVLFWQINLFNLKNIRNFTGCKGL